ncbi:uncharacterized protein LOC106175530 [Lingula anatina]|uniref:Uncharacterized protein LOC106175530 n=1 Tax=Lingula anatina TaxID=7574 RepID=A0A1S3JRN3_LINAN|nr:uncharacterized protein LOC106175530 [Lingula anatina]XP_013413045.1 uncharacterized protein LOC106175530 [Lingula anatina]|eukprot:XP_013413044.1 uncharacterized protein LOC106175530 [Lingula anatina]
MASSTLRQQQTSQRYRYDFCVVYYNTDQVRGNPDYEDGSKSLKFVKTLVKLLEKITWPYGNNARKLRGYYADRDLLPGRMIINEHFQVLGESRYTIVVLSPAFIRDCWSEYVAQSAFRELIDTSRFVPLAVHGVQPTDSGIPKQLNVASIVYFRQGESPEEDESAWSKVKKTVLCENPRQRDLDEQVGASGPIVPDSGGSASVYSNIPNEEVAGGCGYQQRPRDSSDSSRFDPVSMGDTAPLPGHQRGNNFRNGPSTPDVEDQGEGYTDSYQSVHPSPTHHGNNLDPAPSLSYSARSPLSVRDVSLPTLDVPPTYSLGDLEDDLASAQISAQSDNLGNDADNQGQVPGNDVSEDEPVPIDCVRGDPGAQLGSNHPQNTPEAAADNENAQNEPSSPEQTIPPGHIPMSLNLQAGEDSSEFNTRETSAPRDMGQLLREIPQAEPQSNPGSIDMTVVKSPPPVPEEWTAKAEEDGHQGGSGELPEGGGAEGDAVQGSVHVTMRWNPLQGIRNTLRSISQSLSDNLGL